MSILRDDAKKVADALAALKALDATRDAMLADHTRFDTEAWDALNIQRWQLNAVLAERAGILARLVMAATP